MNEWSDIESRFGSGTLLLGNGSSQAVHQKFGYSSLMERARTGQYLNADALSLFAEFETVNFEEILRHLQSSVRVARALGQSTRPFEESHDAVRDGLIEVVNSVHPSWDSFKEFRSLFRDAVLGYDAIFSLNYDLLLYWAIMSESDGEGFKDAFWNDSGRFDWSDSEFWDDDVRVHYVHGGLHLVRTMLGETRKRQGGSGNLLETFGPDLSTGTTPLFVSEGTSAAKQRFILGSDYLSWCLEQLTDIGGPLVVFGAELSDEDSHIVSAINRSRANPIATSVHVTSQTDEIAIHKLRSAQFPHKKVLVFDSSSHPLGSRNLRVSP